jgi:hypothetical protein
MAEEPKPWQLVRNPDYFRDVLGSMINVDGNARNDNHLVVRFGLTGDGIRPNYQIETPLGNVHPIRGNNHKPDRQVSKYATDELSEERFTFQGVQTLLENCIQKMRG